MAEQYNHTNTSATDILRYLRGEMTSGEMHRLERMALDDPFLEESIEGYRLALQEHGIKAVEAGLAKAANVPKSKNTIPTILPFWRKPIFRYAVAASAVIIFGAWLFSLSTLQQQSEKLAPLEELVTSSDTVVAPAAAQADKETASTSSQIPTTIDSKTVQAAQAKQLPVEQSKNELPDKSYSKLEDFKDDTYDTRSVAAASTPPPPAAISQAKEKREMPPAVHQAEKSYKGIVLNDEGQPVQGAVVRLQGSDKGSVTDKEGNFVLPGAIADSMALVAVSHLGYNTLTYVLRPNQVSTLKLEAAENNHSEVVVSGYATRKSRNLMKSAPENPTDTMEAVPVVPWQEYEQYLKSAKDAGKPEPTYVTLTFEVDGTGKIDHVVAIESGGRKRNQQAEKMLREGPAWRSKTGKTAEAKVTFVF